MGLFRGEQQETLYLVKCPEEIDDASCRQLETVFKTSWLGLPVKIFVFDFSQTTFIGKTSYRLLMPIFKSIRAKEQSKLLFSINLSRTLASQLKGDGMIDQFGVVDSLKTALSKVALQPART